MRDTSYIVWDKTINTITWPNLAMSITAKTTTRITIRKNTNKIIYPSIAQEAEVLSLKCEWCYDFQVQKGYIVVKPNQ